MNAATAALGSLMLIVGALAVGFALSAVLAVLIGKCIEQGSVRRSHPRPCDRSLEDVVIPALHHHR